MEAALTPSILVSGLAHPECVTVGPNGLLYAGGDGGQIYEVTMTATGGRMRLIASTGGTTLGLAVDRRGEIYACNAARRAVLRVSPATGEVVDVSAGPAGRPFACPNFPAFASDGSLFVTDSGGFGSDDGVVVRIPQSGPAEVWCDRVPSFPNGCCLSSDGRMLYVVESTRARVVSVELLHDGSAGEVRVAAELPDTVPDGVALTADGCLVIACFSPNRVYHADLLGRVTVLLDDPEGRMLRAPTNACFAGPHRRSIVIAGLHGEALAVATSPVAGAELFYPDRGP